MKLKKFGKRIEKKGKFGKRIEKKGLVNGARSVPSLKVECCL